MKKMAADPETQRWWTETDPCQSPFRDAAAKGKIWSDTKGGPFLEMVHNNVPSPGQTSHRSC
jgi:hypothetical protein